MVQCERLLDLKHSVSKRQADETPQLETSYLSWKRKDDSEVEPGGPREQIFEPQNIIRSQVGSQMEFALLDFTIAWDWWLVFTSGTFLLGPECL